MENCKNFFCSELLIKLQKWLKTRWTFNTVNRYKILTIDRKIIDHIEAVGVSHFHRNVTTLHLEASPGGTQSLRIKNVDSLTWWSMRQQQATTEGAVERLSSSGSKTNLHCLSGGGHRRRPMHPKAVHAGVVWVAPVGRHLDLDDLEVPVTVLLSTTQQTTCRPSSKEKSGVVCILTDVCFHL